MYKRQVYNLGFSKTGTTTVEDALSILGYRVARGHWQLHYLGYLEALCINRDYDEILSFTKSYDAFCDAPWGGGTDLYKYLAAHLPDARFLLTMRAPDAWYRSLETLLTAIDRNLDTALSSYADAGLWTSVYWFRNVFDIRQLAGQKEKIITRYNEYNRCVIAHFSKINRPLLVLDLSDGGGWKPLCDFLGEAVPEVAFPHSNPSPLPADWLDNKIALHRELQRRLFPAPPPMPPSEIVRAGVLIAERRLPEAATLLQRMRRDRPDDADIVEMSRAAGLR